MCIKKKGRKMSENRGTKIDGGRGMEKRKVGEREGRRE